MDQDRDRNREEAIVDALLDVEPEQRRAALDEACAEDPGLRHLVEELLRLHDRVGEVLKLRNHPQRAAVAAASEVGARVGDRIGRYKLLQQIGEGGCGVVYLAEQNEPVKRQVALKVIKLGMDTRQVIARFEAERQALALMDHANIAKVLDGGATESGRPFFVMELVKGIPITHYCDEHQLEIHQRLELFIQVCQAVQHAHQKGVIHRDLKPSNILVADHDGVGVPKVIDFGIAKATAGQTLTDKTLFTALEQFVGTPAYMSPEQAELTMQDADTRTDIYSLGVLLYELLTGKTPFNAQQLLASGLDAMRRAIREQQPERPSTKLSTMLEVELTTTARHRHIEEVKLVHSLRGDLDWIVMKCLEKERARRYETANSLANDVQRHLKCEPVVARPPSKLYEFQKTVRRHKFGFAAATALILVLAVGMVGSAWEAARAWRAEREQIRLREQAVASQAKSQTEAAKATAISDFLQQMLRSANPDALKGSEYTVRQMLDDFSAGLTNQLAGQPEVEAAVRATLGNAYWRLGVLDKAQPHLERALALRRRLYGDQSEEVAQSLVDQALVLRDQGRRPEAEAEARQALDIYRRRGAGAQPIMRALWALAVCPDIQQQFRAVEAVSEQALTLARNSPGRDFPELANILHNLSDAKLKQGKYVEAEDLAQQALEMHRRLHGPDHPETAWSLVTLGGALAAQHKLVEAERSYRDAVAIFGKYYSFGHSSVQGATAGLRAVLEEKGDTAAVEALYREVLDLQPAFANDNAAVAQTLSVLAQKLAAQGSQPEAETAMRAGMEIAFSLREPKQVMLPECVRGLAEVLRSRGKSQDAEKFFETAINLSRQKLGETNFISGELIHYYGDFLDQENKLEAAAEWQLKAVAIKCLHPDSSLGYTLANLVSELVALGRTQQAEPYYVELLAFYRSNGYPIDGLLANHTRNLLLAGKFLEAEPIARDCLTLREKEIPDDWRTFNVRSMLGGALLGQKKFGEETEAMLLTGYKGMKQRENKIPQDGRPRLKETLQRLVQLYEETKRPEQAAEWKQKLDEFDKAPK